ncbi:MAG: 4Fe-4S dicluster domain-containing protein [candidate division Zixibacteria bacterium]|nr:4Fe-4S dicluster domain-containing protein [candidate division Zixibacteria bacterium]
MELKRIKVTSAKCSGCRLCMQICAISHFDEINPRKASLKIEAHFPQPGAYRPRVCSQCGKCMEVCPEGAIYRRDDGAYIVLIEKCTNCGECIPICKPGVIFQHPDVPHVIICDNCFKCTELCNTGAITVHTRPVKEGK